jgi:hypothetical protein
MKLRVVTAALLLGFVCAYGTSAAVAQSPGIQPKVSEPAAKGSKAKNDLGGSDEEQNACYKDASKYCSDAIPDTFKVLDCLKEHRKRLTKACQQVLTDNGQ